MRNYLVGAPAWVPVALQTVVFAVVWTTMTAFEDHRFDTRLLIIGAGVGVLFGLVMGLDARRQRQRTDYIVRGFSAAQRRAVARAVATGVPPEDPALRVASVAMASDALERYTRTKTATIAIFVAFAVISAVAALSSWWYLGAAAFFSAAIVWALRYPRGLRKRIAALDPGDGQATDQRLGAH